MLPGMMRPDMIPGFPTWLIAVLTVGLTAAGAVAIELLARRLFPLDHRRAHNDVAAAMFSVIGVTFAVLLAFVTMICVETYDNARAAVANEATAARDVASAAASMPPPLATHISGTLAAYLRQVIDQEWPAQIAGRRAPGASPALADLNASASAYEPPGAGASNRQAVLLADLGRLQDARATRLQAARYGVPDLVWLVLLVGGALTVVSGSFLGAPRTIWHVAMSATLAISGGAVVFLIIVLSEPLRGDRALSPAPYQEVLVDITR